MPPRNPSNSAGFTAPRPSRRRQPALIQSGAAVFAILLIFGLLPAIGLLVPHAEAESPWRRVTDGLWGDSVFELIFIGNPTTGTRTHLMHSVGFGIFRAGILADDWRASPPNALRPSQTVRALALGRGDPDGLTAYAGLQSSPHFARTEDGGRTWVAEPGPAGPSKIDLVETTTSGQIYAAEASGFGMWTSVDKGMTWTPHPGVIGPLEPVDDLFAEPADPVIYLLSEGKLFKSLDVPDVWTEVLGPIVTNPVTATMSVEMAVAGPRGRVFAIGHLAESRRLAASEDRGASWKAMTWPAGATGEPTAIGSGEISFGEVGVWLGLDDGTVWRSANDGKTWELVATLPTSVASIAVDPANRWVYAGSDGLGLHRISPTELQTGAVPAEILSASAPLYASDSRVWALARITPVRNDPLGGLRPSLSVFFRSDDGGDSWIRQLITEDLGSSLFTSSEFVIDRSFYIGPWISKNGGFNWQKLGGIPGVAGRVPHVIATGPVTITKPTLYALSEPYLDGRGGTGLYYSEDGGEGWRLADDSVGGIVHAAISPGFQSDSTALFVTDRGTVYRTADTIDFGEVSRVRLIAGQGNVHAFEMAKEFVRDGTLAMTVEDNASPDRANVYISNDRGDSWELRPDDIERAARPRAVALSPAFRSDRTIFVGMAALRGDPVWPAIYASDSAALDWFAELLLPDSFEVNDLEWAGPAVGGRIFASAGRAGMWVRDVDGGPIGEVLPTDTPVASETPSPTATLGPGTSPAPTGTPGTATPTSSTPTSATPTLSATPEPSPTDSGTPNTATSTGTSATETGTPGTPGTPNTPVPTVTMIPTNTVAPSETPTVMPSSSPTTAPTATPFATPTASSPPPGTVIYLPYTRRRVR